jgi:hypothetical protein
MGSGDLNECADGAKIFPRPREPGEDLRLELESNYGVGDASVVVVLSIVVPSVPPGVMVSIGVDSAGVVTTVVLFSVAGGFTTVELFSVVAGEGLTTVVLFSVSPGEAAGATVSVFCSHATRSAAPARMQIYFFIGLDEGPCWVNN